MFSTRHFGKFSTSDLNPPYSLTQPTLVSKNLDTQRSGKSNRFRLIKKLSRSFMASSHVFGSNMLNNN